MPQHPDPDDVGASEPAVPRTLPGTGPCVPLLLDANNACRRRAAARRALALLRDVAPHDSVTSCLDARTLAVWTRTWLSIHRGPCPPESGLYVTAEDTAPLLG